MSQPTTAADPMDPKPKNANKIRKRAPKACLSCRARKVRCDVSQRGRPCMNCYLDNETCVVTGRASRFRRSQRENGENVQASYPPYAADNCNHAHTAEAVVKSRANVQAMPEAPAAPQPPAANSPDKAPETAEALPAPKPQVNNTSTPAPALVQSQNQASNALPNPPQPTANLSLSSFSNDLPESSLSHWAPFEQKLNMSSDITYSYYPFLHISNLPNIPPQDVNYLELQGCLRVPTRAILDEFVQQYFLHVHPLLPIFNEGDFWELYCNQGLGNERMSLLVFQSILFATCNFVSRNSIQALGFSTIRSARAALYRRAKLLYDLETESSPVAISQASLLLSFWSPNRGPRNPNSAWLTTAIQMAKGAEAHHYANFSPGKPASTLKRLWWCCIIRDRVLGLGVRRSIQITRQHFDFDSNSPLGYSDLSDEIERSRVYNPGTKRSLIEILVQFLELCVVLTDILILVFPLDDAPGWGRELAEEDAGKVKQCKIELRRWYRGATLKFPMFGGSGVARAPAGSKEYHHDSVILYTNLMYMYYHSSRVALCHHEVLHMAVASAAAGLGNSGTRDISTIYENRYELQDASSGVTECLKELIQLRLARWLPISAVACTALPLVLHILDVKLSTPASQGDNQDPNNSSALKQHRLNILIEAMKTYQPQYDGVDWVSETIRHIINLAQLDNAPAPANGGASAISDWTDILASHPSCYLRLALTMDLALSKNRMPEERDFPASLRGLFTNGFSPLRILQGQNKPKASTAGVASHGQATPRAAAASAATTMGMGMGMSGGGSGTITPINMMSNGFGMAHEQPLFGMQMEMDIPLGMGTVTQLPSDEETSPESAHHTENTSPAAAAAAGGVASSSSAAPQGAPAHGGGNHIHDHSGVQAMPAAPFSEEMDGFEAHVLNAFAFQDDSPPSSGSDVDGVFGVDDDEWIQDAWQREDEHHMHAFGGHRGEMPQQQQQQQQRGDHETARALLDAIKDNEVMV